MSQKHSYYDSCQLHPCPSLRMLLRAHSGNLRIPDAPSQSVVFRNKCFHATFPNFPVRIFLILPILTINSSDISWTPFSDRVQTFNPWSNMWKTCVALKQHLLFRWPMKLTSRRETMWNLSAVRKVKTSHLWGLKVKLLAAGGAGFWRFACIWRRLTRTFFVLFHLWPAYSAHMCVLRLFRLILKLLWIFEYLFSCHPTSPRSLV